MEESFYLNDYEQQKPLDNRIKRQRGGTVSKRTKRSGVINGNGHSLPRAVNKDGFFINDLLKQLKLL